MHRRLLSGLGRTARRRCLSTVAALATVALGAAAAAPAAQAAEPGFRAITVPGADPIPVMLFYPTTASPRPIPMGPWTVSAAPGAPADQPLKGLIVLSHGTGGTEVGHQQLATGLAAAG